MPSNSRADLWWSNVIVDLSAKKLTRWVMDLGGRAGTGEDIPDVELESEAWMRWKETYCDVLATLYTALDNMRPVVVGDSRWQALGEHGRMLDRVAVIRNILTGPESSAALLVDGQHAGYRPNSAPSASVTKPSRSSTSVKRPAPDCPSPPQPTRPKPTSFIRPRAVTPSSSSDYQSGQPSVLKNFRHGSSFISSLPPGRRASLFAGTSSSATSFDPVWRPRVDSFSRHHKDQEKLMLDHNPWGHRCCVCGCIKVGNEGHMSHRCPNTMFATTAKEPVLVKKMDKPQCFQVQVDGPHKGKSICWSWNTRRTKDGRCYDKNCPFNHQCSLCLDSSHRALDCVAKDYLPKLPPRPAGMIPADVVECWRQFIRSTSSKSDDDSNPHKLVYKSSQSRPVKTKAIGPTSSQILMPPPSLPLPRRENATASYSTDPTPRTPPKARTTQSPGVESSATSSASQAPIRYKIIDEFFQQAATPSDIQRSTISAKFPSQQNPVPLATPFRFDPESYALFDTPQMYHKSVPSRLQVRHGYQNRIMPNQILDKLEDPWKARGANALKSASTIKRLADVDLPGQSRRDDAKEDMLESSETDDKLDVKLWELLASGKVGKKRYQRTDGDAHNCGIGMFADFPPEHGEEHAFTSAADGTRMLGQGGLQSPTLSGNYQLSFKNIVPVFFKVYPQQDSMSIPAPPGHSQKRLHYPNPTINECINYEAADIVSRLEKGVCQMLFGFGGNAKKVSAAVAKLVKSAPDKYESTSVQIRLRPTRMMETGALSLESMLLRDRHGHATKDIGPNQDLYHQSALAGVERNLVHQDQRNLPSEEDMTFEFDLMSHKSHPDKCIILNVSDHMTKATSVPNVKDLRVGAKLDIILTLIEDVYFDRFSTMMFPRPSWRFFHRKVESILWADESGARVDTAGFPPNLEDMLRQLRGIVQGYVSIDTLHPRLQSMYQQLNVVESFWGHDLDPLDPIEILLKAAKERESATDIQQTSRTRKPVSRSATPVSTKSTPTNPGDTFEAFCECGTPTPGQWDGLSPMVRLVKVSSTGEHPVRGNLAIGDQCLTGIAFDGNLAARSVVRKYRARTSAPPTFEELGRILKAGRIYGTIPDE